MNVYQRIQSSFDVISIGYKKPIILKTKPTFNTDSIELACENDVTMGIPIYIYKPHILQVFNVQKCKVQKCKWQ